MAAQFGTPPELAKHQRRRGPVEALPGSILDRATRTKQVVYTGDDAAAAVPGASARYGGARSGVCVPMLKDDALVGAFTIYRQEVRPFTDRQIALLTNFAAQAVIAIENTRLLNELRESLDRQTATADILRVIAGTPEDSKRALDTIAEKASRMFDSANVNFRRLEGNVLRVVSAAGPSFAKLREVVPDAPLEPPTEPGVRCVLENRQIAVEDRLATPPNEHGEIDRALQDLARRGLPIRSQAFTPLLREGKAIGVMIVSRAEVRPFQEHELELMKGFADQAVIAIENARLLNELRESLEQQTASTDVLRVISSSPGKLEPVFQSTLENAVHICQASFGNLLLYEDGAFRHVALHNAPEAWAAEQRRDPIAPRRSARFLYRVADTKQIAHIADIAAENPDEPIARVAGARTLLIVPMLKENALVGVIAIYRQEVRPFTDKQIELVKSFAAQAVIAIENTRLLNELRESLQQQTATSEVLGVISSSPGELEPVFQTMLANATRICEAKFGTLFRFDGKTFHPVAQFNTPAALLEAQKRRARFEATARTPIDYVMRTKQVFQSADNAAEPVPGLAAKLAGARSLVAVPMLKDNALIGAIIIYRQEVRPFTDKQIALVQNFAAQAVIAIENARLLNELRQRTSDLSESLEQQTATSEVLRVISSSPGELKPVFQAMLQNAITICGAKFGQMFLCEQTAIRMVAHLGVPAALAEFDAGRGAFHPTSGGALERVLQIKQVVHSADVSSEFADSPVVRLGGARSYVGVPLLKDDELIGAISIYRQEVRPFTEKQIELITNFAAQAVIAIENTRLLNELRQSLEHQTATAEVLKIISRSTFDLKAVLNTLVESATRVCEADCGNIARPQDGGTFFVAASYGMSPEFMAEMDATYYRAGRGTAIGRALLERKTIHIVD
ncbi:MAG: GAF domain-containing protein, partial [Xanthobacteraceae bacterium]